MRLQPHVLFGVLRVEGRFNSSIRRVRSHFHFHVLVDSVPAGLHALDDLADLIEVRNASCPWSRELYRGADADGTATPGASCAPPCLPGNMQRSAPDSRASPCLRSNDQAGGPSVGSSKAIIQNPDRQQ